MKKKSICLALLIAGLFLMTGFVTGGYNAKVAYAATKGTVTTTGLRVRTDAGTDKAVLTHNGTNVTLTKDTKVTIHSKKSVKGVTWYEVTFTYQGKSLKGYVSGDYVKVEESSGGQSNSGNAAEGDSGSTNDTTSGSGITTEGNKTETGSSAKMSIPVKVTADSLNVRTGASMSDSKLSVDGQSVILKKGTIVQITKEVKNGEQEWYEVSFTYNNKTVKGYILSDYTNLVLTRDVSALTSSSKVKLYKKAGTDKKVKKLNGKKINLAKGTEVLIIKETKDANGAKWFKVKCGYKGVLKKGFIPASNLALNKVIPVQGKVTTDNLRVRTGAGTNNGQMMLNDKAVLLKQGQILTISAQSKVDNTTWYKVSFTYEKKTLTGYVSGDYVELMKYALDLGTPDKEDTGSESIGNSGTGNENTADKNTGTNGTGSENPSDKNPGTDGTGNENTGNNCTGSENNKDQNTGNGSTGTNGSGNENTAGGNTGNNSSGSENNKDQNTGNGNTGSGNSAAGGNNTGGNSGNTSGGNTADTPSTEVITDIEAFLTEQRFPESYKKGLRALYAAHPTWVFKAYHTGLNWEDAVNNESRIGLNLISNNKTNGWKSYEEKAYSYLTDKFIVYDGSTWVTASKEAVAYYMDPRNFMTERGMFQFLTLEYQKDHENLAGVENILANTPLHNTSYTYMDETMSEVSKTYGQTFMEAAEKSGVSPYHLATRVKQEVVTNSITLSGSASGKFVGYEGYYNFYNIGATHSTEAGGAIANALNFAMGNKSSEAAKVEYSLPWNNQYDAIVGGAAYIGSQYINRGQNTIYLQKFNVTPNSTYTHQYMANVEVANSEAIKLYNGYASVLDTDLVFYIPVYENMPEEKVPVPGNVLNPNNWLKSLTVGEYVLTPAFNAEVGSTQPYVLSLELEDVTEVNLEAVAVNKKATILITQINKGNLSIVSNSGSAVLNLQTGLNEIEIIVTAENGVSNVYKVTITK